MWFFVEVVYFEDVWVCVIYVGKMLVGLLMMVIWDFDEVYYIW